MTHIRNVDLTTRHARIEAAGTIGTTHATGKCAAVDSARRTEPRLGFTILTTSQPQNRPGSATLCKQMPHLSDIDQSAHKILVAECRNGILGLLPRGILHYSERPLSAFRVRRPSHGSVGLTRIPKSRLGTTSQPVNPTFHQVTEKRNHKKNQPKSLVGAHLRHSVGKKQHIGVENLSSCDRRH